MSSYSQVDESLSDKQIDESLSNSFETYSEREFKSEMFNILEPMENLLDNSDVTEIYNPYEIPADLQKAKLHSDCQAFGVDTDANEICGCCAKNHKKELKLCDRNYEKKIVRYGIGYVIFFWVLFFTICLLIFPVGASAIFYSVKNFRGGECMTIEQRTKDFNQLRNVYIKQWNWDGIFAYPPSKGTKSGKHSLYHPPNGTRRTLGNLIKKRLTIKYQNKRLLSTKNIDMKTYWNQKEQLMINLRGKNRGKFSFVNHFDKLNVDIDQLLKATNASSVYIIMYAFCKMRFFYKDYMCDIYKKAGCPEMINIGIKEMFKVFFTNSHDDVQRLDEAYMIKMNGAAKVEKCHRLAFQKVTLTYTYRSCIISRGTFLSEFGLGNEFNNLEKGFWDYFFAILTFVFFFLGIQISGFVMEWKNTSQDFNQNSPTDYVIEVSDLPKEQNIPDYNIKEAIIQLFETKGLHAKDVSMLYDTDYYTEKQEELKGKRTELAKLIYKQKNGLLTKKSATGCGTTAEDFQDEVMELESDIIRTKDECDILEETFKGQMVDTFQGSAFVSFSLQKEKQEALSRFGPGKHYDYIPFFPHPKEKLRLKMNGKNHNLQVRECVSPQAVDYKNQKYAGKRWWRILLMNFILLLIFLIMCSGIFVATIAGLNLKDQVIYYDIQFEFLSWKWIVNKIFCLMVSLSIVIFNKIIEISVKLIVKFTKHRDRTDGERQIISYLFFMTFINTGIVPMLACFVCINLMGPIGLVSEINSIFIANLITTNLMEIVDFPWIIKKLHQCQYTKASNKNDKKVLADYVQHELNTLYERDDFEIEIRFTIFYRNFALALLYLPILPFGVFYTVLYSIANYYISKWVLFYRSSNEYPISYSISKNMMYLTEFCQFVYTVGLYAKDILIYFYAADSLHSSPVYMTMMIISFILYLLPNNGINWLFKCATKTCLKKCYDKMKDKNPLKKKPSYLECKDDFDSTYITQNPAYSKESNRKFIVYKIKKNIKTKYKERKSGLVAKKRFPSRDDS